MKIKDFEEVESLHYAYSRGKNSKKWVQLTLTHSKIVKYICLLISDKLEKRFGIIVNKELLEIGALIHDIGVYSCYDDDFNPIKNLPKYIEHGYLGYKILLKENFPEKIARFASTHTGVGITSEDIERDKLPIPLDDYMPITLEEEILCYADKFHTKWPKFLTFDEQKSKLEKMDISKGIKMEVFKKKFGIPELELLKEEYKDWHREMNLFIESIVNN